MKSLTMQALVWLGPREMVERAEPVPQPALGEVLISVAATGICGSELSGFLGHNSLRVPPLIMGHECAGEVVQGAGETFATGETAGIGTRITFNPLIACGTCDRCRAGRPNLCRQRPLIGAPRPGRRGAGGTIGMLHPGRHPCRRTAPRALIDPWCRPHRALCCRRRSHP